MRPSQLLVLALFALVPLHGCGSSNPPADQAAIDTMALADVGELLRSYQVQNNKAPLALNDVQAMEMMAPLGLQAVKEGKILVYWGVTLPDTNEEPGQSSAAEVLAYYKEVPEKGGPVLLKNRTITTMTAAEFQAAPKAGKLY
jgi:hypothetical protein